MNDITNRIHLHRETTINLQFFATFIRVVQRVDLQSGVVDQVVFELPRLCVPTDSGHRVGL